MHKMALIFLSVGLSSILWLSPAMAYVESDSFEGQTFTPFWSLVSDSFGFAGHSLSTDLVRSGMQADKEDSSVDRAMLIHYFGQDVQGDISIWVNSGLPDGSSTTTAPAVGVSLSNGGIAWGLDSISREEGWHKISMNVNNNGMKMYVDDGFLLGDPGLKSITGFSFGAFRGSESSIYHNYYFDDFYANVNPVVTPEPTAMLLYGLGGLPMATYFLRRRRKDEAQAAQR